METVTLQGPVVLLPSEDYQNLIDRVAQLERAVAQLTRVIEDSSDMRAMDETEAEYLTGDRVSFGDLLAEVDEEEITAGVQG